MLLGFEVTEKDINEFFLDDEKKLPKKWQYSNTYEYNFLPISLRIKSRSIDFGSTYDGFTIGSVRFKAMCEKHNFKGIDFFQLPNDLDYYLIKVNNVLEFDPISRNTRFMEYSKEHKGYREIIGATPVCLKNNEKVPEGSIYRTDIFFGSGVTKSPVLMVGIETKLVMEAWKVKGIGYNKILDRYPWQK